MGLALIAFLLTIPWVSIAKQLRASFVYCLRALSPRRHSRKSSPRTQTPSSQNDTQYSEALTSALVGFQKAQCWFMLATNIAGLIVEKSGGLEPDSLQQLYNTYVFIKVIAIGGFLPITFSLLNLHMIQMLSWYPIALSIATIVVAIATLKSGHTSFTPIQEDFDSITSALSQHPVESCGSQNLIPWCYAPRSDGSFGFNGSSNGSSADDILIFCLVTLAIILIDHFCRSDDPKQQALNGRILKKLRIDPSKALFPHAGAVLRYGTPVFHFVFFWLYIYCFYLFGEDLNWFAANNVYDPGWGVGQIVAVAVWLPTLFDYAWDQLRTSSFFPIIVIPFSITRIRILSRFAFLKKGQTRLTFSLSLLYFFTGGVEKGSQHKLPKMYQVVKKVQQDHHDNNATSRQESRDLEMESPLKLPYHNLRDGGSR